MSLDKNPVQKVSDSSTNIADGAYQMAGIEFIDSSDKYTDDSGLPLYYSKNGGNPYIIVSTILEDGSKGPGLRIIPGEVGMLVKVFGQDPEQLPSAKDEVRRLVTARELINNSGKTITINVRNGYVQSIPSMQLPVGQYWMKYVGVSTYLKGSNKVPGWIESKYNYPKQFAFQLEVVGDQFGRETPYTGMVVTRKVPYAINYDAVEDIHKWDKDKPDDETISTSAGQLVRIIETFAPELLDKEEFVDVNNIVPEFDTIARKRETVLIIKMEEWNNDRGVGTYVDIAKISSSDWVPVEMRSGVIQNTIDTVIDNREESGLAKLKEVIQNRTDEDAFESNGKLSAAGGKWCLENLVDSGLWIAIDGPVNSLGKRTIEDLDNKQINLLLKLLEVDVETGSF